MENFTAVPQYTGKFNWKFQGWKMQTLIRSSADKFSHRADTEEGRRYQEAGQQKISKLKETISGEGKGKKLGEKRTGSVQLMTKTKE